MEISINGKPYSYSHRRRYDRVSFLDRDTFEIRESNNSDIDIVLGHTSLAQLSAWQDYASRQLFIQQISIPLTATNNIRVLPECTGIISLVLKLSKTSFIPCHTIIGKGIAHVKPFDLTLPLRPVEIEFENNRCCLEVCNTSDCTIEFQYSQEITYFDARSKGLVQINNSKHFPIDQYLHDRVTQATLSPKPIAYDNLLTPQKCHVFQHVQK